MALHLRYKFSDGFNTVFSVSDAEFSGSDNEETFLPRKSATDDLFDLFCGNSRIQRKGSCEGRQSSIKGVEYYF